MLFYYLFYKWNNLIQSNLQKIWQMKNPNPLSIILVLLVGLAVAQSCTTTPICPNPAPYSTVLHGHLQISLGGAVALVTSNDVLCYNYSLPAPFQNRPGVAIAVKSLQANPSQDLFFSIRSAKPEVLSLLTFLVRTQWKYTSWTLLSASFFAEDSADYEANWFSIDTTALAGCSQVKQVNVILPYRTANFQAVNALAFLNGFQMSSTVTCLGQTSSNPFEVQILSVTTVAQGVSLQITTTSNTEVFLVFISFVAYNANVQNAVASRYEYNSFQPINQLSTSLASTQASSSLDFVGVTGFIITNGPQFFINTTFVNQITFTFTTITTFQYFSFSYFFLSRTPCWNCINYPLFYSNTCYASCPTGTYQSGNVCLSCPAGQQWNGNACVAIIPTCPAGQVWNGVSCVNVTPQCPSGYYWNGTACVSNVPQCPAGQYWNGSACVPTTPQCPAGQYWNGTCCVSNTPQCPAGQYWNGTCCVNNVPQCPSGYYWNGSACVSNVPQCPSGQYWNGNACVPTTPQCPAGQYWNGSACVSNVPQCPSGQYWNGSACVCPSGQYWNGASCVPNIPQCPPGQMWNGAACIATCTGGQFWNGSACICPTGQYWSGTICITCGLGQIWNSSSLSCYCPNGLNWNGYNCISCPNGQYWSAQTNGCSCPYGQNWNGFTCITCSNGQIWQQSVNACQCPNGLNWNGSQCINCPAGQNWNGAACITCVGGQVWDSVNLICYCSMGYQWNGSNCIVPCPAGQVSIGGICQCPTGTYFVNGACQTTPNCPSGSTWNGTACSAINCPAGYYWNGNSCTAQTQNCPAGTYWDGFCCVAITNQCPSGMIWNGQACVTNITRCPIGSYWNGVICVVISQQCLPPMNWINGQCVCPGNQCPPGTYLSGTTCVPLAPCTNGKIWNTTLAQCVCPLGSFWNGNTCFNCGGGQIYDSIRGCYCPYSLFWNGVTCAATNSSFCLAMDNSQWVNGACVCLPGFVQQGQTCICTGLVTQGNCDQCYMKPNSNWRFGVCQCIAGFYQQQGQCLPCQPNPNPNPNPNCNVATFFDNQQKRCLPCSDGCLACSTCYQCTQCRPEYTFNPVSQLCNQICGDAKRFSLQCDDGNNVNGDGCSSDCRIEANYQCTGGSPNSKDSCTSFLPNKLVISQSGQTHLNSKIVLNIRLNYLPLQLINSANDCKNKCDSVLQVKITKGDKSFVSIKSSYIPTTSYSFSVIIDFGREPIGLFTAEVSLQTGIALKYYSGIDTSQVLSVDINPAFLSLYRGGSGGRGKGKGHDDDLL